jgi:4-amino-4-deoxy-L-arabinose transferase-like glycosyltransferase
MGGLLLTCVCGFLFFFGLAHFGLIGADEPRYAQVAREMLVRQDWITPTLSGTPWLEKPPLYYWQAMLAYRIFGVSDWAARLPSALDATCMIVAIYFFLARFRRDAELDGALMTASAAGVIGFARAASMDMPLAATFAIGLLAWYAWLESKNKGFLAAFYLFVALGTLAKGPVAPVLAAVVVVTFAFAKGDRRLIARTLWVPGILLFCLLVLPWYAAVQIRNPQFFREFILQHNLARFGTNLYHHKAPFWYYAPVTLIALAPWSVLVLAALAESASLWWRQRRRLSNSVDAFPVFLIVWMIVPLVFFSISQSKLPGYVVPAIPAGTLLLADYLRQQRAENERPRLGLALLHAMVAAGLMVPALLIRYLLVQPRLPWDQATWVSLTTALVLALAIALSLLSRAGFSALRFVTMVPVVLALAIVLRLGATALDNRLSARPLANEIARIDSKRLPIAVFRVSREVEYGLAFYRNQTVSRYESGQIPSREHFLVAPAGLQMEVARQVPGRHVSYLGQFAPQKLEYFWMAGADH